MRNDAFRNERVRTTIDDRAVRLSQPRRVTGPQMIHVHDDVIPITLGRRTNNIQDQYYSLRIPEPRGVARGRSESRRERDGSEWRSMSRRSRAERSPSNPASMREARDGEARLDRLALKVAHRNAEGVGKEMRDTGALNEGRTIIGRWFRAHGLGGRQLGRAPDRAQHPQGGRHRRHHQRHADRPRVQMKTQVRETEEHVVHLRHLPAQ